MAKTTLMKAAVKIAGKTFTDDDRDMETLYKLLDAYDARENSGLVPDQMRVTEDEISSLISALRNSRVRTETPVGAILAYMGTDPAYPSIEVMLVPKGRREELLLSSIEYAGHGEGEGLRLVSYADATDDEPTAVEPVENLDKYLALEEEEKEKEGKER